MSAEGSPAAVVRCPEPEVLQKLLLGGLTGAEAEALAGHLARCAGCLEMVETLAVGDGILDLVRAERSRRGAATDESLDALLRRLRQEAPPETSLSATPVAAGQPTAGFESMYVTVLPSPEAIMAA